MKTIIHVNRSLIALNIKRPTNPLPIYTVKTEGSNVYGYSVEILGPSRFVDSRSTPQLSCGARAWLETDSEVVIEGAMTWDAVQLLKNTE
jgi:hypothetical protein